MGISSLGAGSSILTQDVLDQLRAADEAGKIRPLELKIANENDKKNALEVLDASMTNFIDSISALASFDLFDERSVTTTGTSVEVTASSGSDIQEFTLNVNQLATKQIEESGSFSSESDYVGSGGQINLNVDGKDYTIDYTATTTLKQLKDLINEKAGASVDATLLNVGANDVRLVISSANTGSTQNISITDVTGTLDSKLKDYDATTNPTGLKEIQGGLDAEFTFNGGSTIITRSSNQINDLVTGYNITLKETGLTQVAVSQNRDSVIEKIDSFVNKYNEVMTEISKQTKVSTDSTVRGIFSNESTIKGMQSAIRSMMDSVGGGVGSLMDYGFDIDKEGTLTLNKDMLTAALDANPDNVKAFFTGGDFTNSDTTITNVTGAFNEMSTIIGQYTDYNATLDLFKNSITDALSTLEERKTIEIGRLDSKFEILKKQFTAYDLIISKFNSMSSMFSQMVAAQNTTNN